MLLSLKGLDQAAVLAALFNAARPLGMGWLHYRPRQMPRAEAVALLAEPAYRGYFDYLEGRLLKVKLGGDVLDTWGYDRDNGEGAAKHALEAAGLPAVEISTGSAAG